MRFVCLFLALSLSLAACSRKAEKTALTDAPLTIGPTVRDGEVPLSPLSAEDRSRALTLEGPLTTASVFRLSEDLLAIDQRDLSLRLWQAYQGARSPQIKLSDSLFTQTLIGEAEPEVRKQLAALAKQLNRATDALTGLLQRSRKDFAWPRRLTSFPQAISVGDGYAEWLLARISRLGLHEEIAGPVERTIRAEYKKLRPVALDYAHRLQNSQTLGQALVTTKKMFSAFGVELRSEQRRDFAKAEELVHVLSEVNGSQDALNAIIFVWRMVPPRNREAVFKQASPEIYDFLKDKDDFSLDCLTHVICVNPLLEGARRLVILPKISSYGVRRIQAQIDGASRDYLLRNLLEEATAMLPRIPALIQERVVAEAKEYKKLVAMIQKDLPGFARGKMAAWEKENFSRRLGGLDSNTLSVRWRVGERPRLAVPARRHGGVESGAEVIGTSLAIAHNFLPEETGRARAALMDPLLKLLALTGFRQVGGDLYPSLLFPLDGPRTELFDVRNLLRGTTSFAVPDSFIASDSMTMARREVIPTASVGAQAELLRGISRQIRFHRDWEKNAFDEALGRIQVEDIVTEVPHGTVNQSAFPKDVVFTLTVGAAASILQNIIRELSPAFLLLPNGRVLWGNQYQQISQGPENISTVAALVNIENGVRGKQVRTADVARYVLALDEFLNATEGIEQTRSALLLEKDAEGRTVLSQLEEARRYLRLFQMGLTNYLAHVAQARDGGVRAGYAMGEAVSTTREVGVRTLEDQVLAIRALLASSRQLGLPIYHWAALDAYYFMNRALWVKESQFYGLSVNAAGVVTGKAGLREIAASLRGIEELAPVMPEAARAQWRKIADPWRKSLDSF